MNKKGSIAIFSIAIVMTFSMLMAVLPTASADIFAITIDGDVGDWAGVTPVATDPSGDTFQWSKNATIVGVGSTAEKAADVAKNDKCRDLKALYFASDSKKIYMRLDVEGLYAGWDTPTGASTAVHFGNVSYFILYCDYQSGPGTASSQVAAAADEVFFSPGNQPELYFQFDGVTAQILSCLPGTEYWVIMDNNVPPDYKGGIEIATDIAAGALEISIDRTQLEAHFGTIGTAHVWVFSYKPGEGWGWWGTWRHNFDPQAPGTPGEDWGAPAAGPQGGGWFWTWTDWGPWGIGHNITSAVAVSGLEGVNATSGAPYSLTYPLFIDHADVIVGGTPFTFPFTTDTVQPNWNAWTTKVNMTSAGKVEVDLSSPGVGGSINPLDKLALLAPWIALAAIVATVSVVYKKKIKPF